MIYTIIQQYNIPPYYYVILLWAALISDIIDGIIARNFGTATRALRIADGWVDLLFWILAALSLLLYLPGLFESSKWFLLIFLVQEPISDLIIYFRFRHQACAHNWASKFFGLWLLGTFTTMLLTGSNYHLFTITLIFGFISQYDRILISLLLPHAECDIPSFWHAYQLKLGQPIKRFKLLN
jgi:CDP-diacylglycerol--glycerol-3-phosphate 3-phosphatidyltransferase